MIFALYYSWESGIYNNLTIECINSLQIEVYANNTKHEIINFLPLILNIQIKENLYKIVIDEDPNQTRSIRIFINAIADVTQWHKNHGNISITDLNPKTEVIL